MTIQPQLSPSELIDRIAWDNHSCMPLRRRETAFLDRLDEVRSAGVDVISVNVGFGDQTAAEHLHMLATFRRWIEQNADRFALGLSVKDILRTRAQAKLSVCFDIEGMNALDGNPDMVSLYYDLGVRWMLGVYNVANAAGGGCLDIQDEGLTEFGRDVIREMNRVGMVVCGSHTGYRTAREMIDASSSPVIFSHSNPRAVFDHPRNIPDELMVACAERGGVIGITGVGLFLGANDNRTETLVRHIEYALDLIGDDHVGLALDYVFDPSELETFVKARPDLFPADFSDGTMRMVEPARWSLIEQALVDRGHLPQTISKLLGGNHLRIAKTVWR